MSKQDEVMNHYFAGGSLTVESCRRLYHTTELRRINSRINHKLNIAGNNRIEGEFAVNISASGVPVYDEFKTYRLVDILKK